MCRRIMRPKQAPPLWVVLGVVLFSVLATPVIALAGSDEEPNNGDGSVVVVTGHDGPEDGRGGGNSGNGEGDPDDPIIDVPETHGIAVKLVLLFTIYLP